jgi:hypothetical protein
LKHHAACFNKFLNVQLKKKPFPTDNITVNALLDKLKNMARTKGLNTEIIANREQLSIYKCLVLIEVMNKANPNLDFNVIKHNLNLLPRIRDFLGQKWLNKMERIKIQLTLYSFSCLTRFWILRK